MLQFPLLRLFQRLLLQHLLLKLNFPLVLRLLLSEHELMPH
jgi:hypothetical protein